MMLPAKVSRSTMAAQRHGSVKVLVQPLNSRWRRWPPRWFRPLGENPGQPVNKAVGAATNGRLESHLPLVECSGSKT
jgi:hypothetical protein